MATETITRTPRTDERVAQVGLLRGLFRRVEIGALIGAVVVWGFFAIVIPQYWISIQGFARILDPSSTLGIMSIAVALLMIGGEFDLSAGVMTGTTGLLAGLLATQAGWNIWPAMLVALVFALAVGYFNGWMVVNTRLPSFIVTLATFFILRGANVGVTRLVTSQVVVSGIDQAPSFQVARGILNQEFQLFGATFRTSTIWWIVIIVIATWVLQRTRYGNWIFAAGGDVNAARNVGVPAYRVKIALFMTTAAAAWLVGMMDALRLRSAVASEGIGQEFVYIIAAVIGGCLLTGGYGSVIGAAIGALIFGMARVGIVFAGWPTDWFYSFLGVMLLVAVLVNDMTRKRAEAMSIAAAKARTEEESVPVAQAQPEKGRV
jgi:simple sugar transport system permease protein